MTYRQWEIPEDGLSERQRDGLAYWRRLAGGGVPPFTEFDLLNLPPESLPTTHIADLTEDGAEFEFRFWGSGFRNHFGYDGTRMRFAELQPEEIRDPVRQATRRVIDERRPIAMMSEFQRGPRLDTQGFQRIVRMPLTGADGAARHVVSLVEFLQDYHESQRIIAAYEGTRF
ncbi:MAG: PAS domain-containing protein [Magnetovibrio sp.]|nr:PAS domain-containing protein [Magnetovibrio sp.]